MKLTEKKLKEIIKEELNNASGVFPRLQQKVDDWDLTTAMKKYGPDVVAIYVSLDVDTPIEKVARRERVVNKYLQDNGFPGAARTYERNTDESWLALEDAIKHAGLTGPESDRYRDDADKYYNV